MGIVIDLIAYKICRDASLAIISRQPTRPKYKSTTKCLYELACEASVIVFYPTENNKWKTCSAFSLAEAMKDGSYMAENPGVNHIKLIFNEKPRCYVDIYFRKSLYHNYKLRALVYAFVEETLRRGSGVSRLLYTGYTMSQELPPLKKIDWDALHKTPFAPDEDDPKWW
ncbi:MAG: hypothetical protein KAY78_00965 [Pseudomonadales bacterium]|nr:hypothetical protein [Pseudomonadales bacterium]